MADETEREGQDTRREVERLRDRDEMARLRHADPRRADSGRARGPTEERHDRRERVRGRRPPSPPEGSAGELWDLRLYVAGQSRKSLAAIANLRRICDEHLPGRYHLEVIDLLEHPQLAQSDQILAIPTLVRKLPAPMRKIIGDLSNTERALVGLDLRARCGGEEAST